MRRFGVWSRHTLAVVCLASTVSFSVAQEKPKIEIVPQLGHTQGIATVAFSSDGARLVSSGGDKSLKLWDVPSGRLVRTFDGHASGVNSVAFSPDGRRLLSGADDKTIKLWDASTGALVRTFAGHTERVNAVAFTRDGNGVISGGADKTLKLWDAASGRIIRTFTGHRDHIAAIAVSPNGSRILSGSGTPGKCNDRPCGNENALKLWDLATGQVLRTFSGHTTEIRSAAFSPNGAQALSSSDNVTLKLWDVESGQLLRTITPSPGDVPSIIDMQLADPALPAERRKNLENSKAKSEMPAMTRAAFLPDGKRIVSSSTDEAAIRVWDVASGKLAGAILDKKDGTSTVDVAVTPDGTGFLAVLDGHKMKLWNAVNGQMQREFLGGGSGLTTVATSPDGTRIATSGYPEPIRLWDSASGRLIQAFGEESTANAVTFAPDGQHLVSAHSDFGSIRGEPRVPTVRMWDVRTGKVVRTFDEKADHVPSIAMSPDGARIVAAGATDETTNIWDARSGRLLNTIRSSGYGVEQVALSADGKILAVGSDAEPTLWNAETGQKIRSFKARSSSVIALSPDARLLATGGAEMALWETATGRQIQVLTKTTSGPNANSDNWVEVLAFAPSGATLAAGQRNGELKLYNSATRRLLVTIQGHTRPIKSIAFTPDGKRIVSASEDSTAKTWDVATGQLISTMLGAGPSEWLTMTPAGFFAASPKASDNLSIIRGLDVTTIDQVWQALFNPDLVRERLANDPDKLFAEGVRHAQPRARPRQRPHAGRRIAAVRCENRQ